MRKILAVSLGLLMIATAGHAHGLRFNGSEKPINERTSFHIPRYGSLSIQGRITISFDFKMFPEEPSGYLFRIESGLIGDFPTIDFFYDGRSEMNDFELIWTGQRFISSLHIPKAELEPLQEWTRVSVMLDQKKDSVFLEVGNRFRSADMVTMPEIPRPEIWFGKSKNLIDVPTFAIRNLTIQGDGKAFSFPLDENSGALARCSKRTYSGSVTNPVWLINDTFRWKKVRSFYSEQFLAVGFDRARQDIYLFNRDTIRYLNLTDYSVRTEAFRDRCPVEIFLGSSFMDPRTGLLYAYEVYDRHEQGGTAPSVAVFDRDNLQWIRVSNDFLGMQMHHHDAFVDTLRHRLVLFGGFGNRRYNGNFYTFDLDRFAWERWRQPAGDPVWPRYFSAMGYDHENGKLYIFGGKGNETGDQIVGGKYLYDLSEVDLDFQTSRTLWKIAWEGENCVAVRGMVFVEDDHFYTLCYPESRTESALRLYRFALRDGKREILADAIPIYSDKITTNANLYFNDRTESFIATVEETTDDIRSKVTIYTLSSPARPVMKSTVGQRRTRIIGEILGTFLVLLLSGVYATAQWLRKRKRTARTLTYIAPEKDKPNSILLFGGFKALDRNGEEISSKFTAKLRSMFLLILKDMGDGGVTSRKISDLLWPEKQENATKNIRGVTANGLRKQLALMDGIRMVFCDRKYSFETTDDFYCDYLEFFKILNSKDPDLDKLVAIVSKGQFLQGETDPLFDRMKAEVERDMEPVMQAEMQRRFELKQYRNTITCAETLLAMDPLNESAMASQIRSLVALDKEEEAVMRYRDFSIQYRKDYGEEFPKSYDRIVLDTSPESS